MSELSRRDRLLADTAYRLVALLDRTLRWEGEGAPRLAAARAGGRPLLFVFWHSRLVYACFRLGRLVRLAMMVSHSRDGELIARVAHDHGIASVRGSSSRGGSAAARQLARAMKEHGICGGITPDGPRGPREVVQPGALLVAKLAGAAIVPVAVGFSRKKVFASWDRFQLPAPFGRGRLVFGEALLVPADTDADAMERLRMDLERRIAAVTAEADRFGRG